MADVYSDFARVYDELMDNAPYKEWCENIAALIQEYGISRPVEEILSRTVDASPLTEQKKSDCSKIRMHRLCWNLSEIWYWIWVVAPAH